jgi:hypothetical protein
MSDTSKGNIMDDLITRKGKQFFDGLRDTRPTMVYKGVEYSQRHGGAFDRGSADAYYRRAFDPHYYTGDTYQSQRIELPDPDAPAYKEYAAGYEMQASSGDFKDWGDWDE